MTHGDQDTRTYRGRSLDELVPQIREELGDDAVIVASREKMSGGVGGFFAKRELEVEARPAETEPATEAARLFAERLREAADVALPPPPGPAGDVSVDDLFTPRPAQGAGLAALFNVGREDEQPTVATPAVAPEAAEPDAPAEPPAVAEPDADAAPLTEDEPAVDVTAEDESPVAEAPVPRAFAPPVPFAPVAPPAVEEPVAAAPPVVDEPALVVPPAVAEAPAPVEPSAPVVEAPAAAAPPVVEEPAPAAERPIPVRPPMPAATATPAPQPAVAPPSWAPPATASAPPLRGRSGPVLPAAARSAAERLTTLGMRPELAEEIAEQAAASLLPLDPGADGAALVREALARRIPTAPLRRGAGVVAFVGPGGAGKTRCVARLAAAHARHAVLPVTVLSLLAPDGGAELTRLLAPYGVPLHVVATGAEGVGRVAVQRGEGLVVVDTPGVSPRSPGELAGLRAELAELQPDEIHLAVPATIAPASAHELVEGTRELGVDALVVTHGDETDQLGTVVGLAIAAGVPLSYLAQGQAVDAGLRPATAGALAATLVP